MFGWLKPKPIKKDEVIRYRVGKVILENPHDILDGIEVNARYIKEDEEGKRLYEIGGVVLDAEDIIDAERKYLKKARNDKST